LLFYNVKGQGINVKGLMSKSYGDWWFALTVLLFLFFANNGWPFNGKKKVF